MVKSRERSRLDLEDLIGDRSYHVRLVLASKGYGLDQLINDESLEKRLK